MFNERISFEQAVRYLTLAEVLELACHASSAPIVERHLTSVASRASSRSAMPTAPARAL